MGLFCIVVSPACGGLTRERCFVIWFLLLFHPPQAGLQVRGVMQFGFYCCYTRLRRAKLCFEFAATSLHCA